MDGTGHKTAIVVGGGLGGLAAAVGLHRAGWDVRVVERAASFGELSVGLTLAANGLRALDALGLGAPVREGGRAARMPGTQAPSGRWLRRANATGDPNRAGTATLSISRVTLHRILREALPRQALTAGTAVVGVRPGGTHASAEVDLSRSGQQWTASADLVVAADGLRSPTRSQLWPERPALVFTRTTAWRGVTSDRWSRELPASITWGRGTEFGIFPLGGGRISWYGAAANPAGHREADELAALRRWFGDWPDPVPSLLAATDAHAVQREDLYALASDLSSYVTGRVALLGDAAHSLPPALNQGVSQALEDAVALMRAADGDEHPREILGRYDAVRRPQVELIARAARASTRPGLRRQTALAA